MESVQEILSSHLSQESGFETHAFKIGWYNDLVSSKFHLPYSPHTVAFLIISRPNMFENTFLPYLQRTIPFPERDPLDSSMVETFQNVLSVFTKNNIESCAIHDFELDRSRRPKVIMQTAGHVSGAVRLYSQSSYYSVALHPSLGGWFALRGVFIFPTLFVPSLIQKDPPFILKNENEISNLILLYNFHWQDNRFRDVIPVKEKYSTMQIEYFKTKPSERRQMLRHYNLI